MSTVSRGTSREPRRIAIFRIGHIGDTIIALPALWTVRKRFPNAHILYLSQQHNAKTLVQGTEVLRRGMVYDEELSYPLTSAGVSKWQLVKTLLKLRLSRIDTLVYLPPFRSPAQLNRDEKFFRLAGIKRIIGMQGYRETDYRPQGSPLPTMPHEADILLSHLARDGVQVDENPTELMDMGLSPEERDEARQWLARHGIEPGRTLIGIGAGSKMPAKLWPIQRFQGVARRLDAEFDPIFITFGSKGESDICQQVCDAVQHGINAAGELTIRQSAAIFEHCRLYIGNDTGTMHLAAACKVPCVAIFSARDWPEHWYPYGPAHHAVHRRVVSCEGCMLEVCDKNNLCLDLITTESVLLSARKLLQASEPLPDGVATSIEAQSTIPS